MNTNTVKRAVAKTEPCKSTIYRITSGPSLDRIMDSFRYEGMIPINFDVVDSLMGGVLALTNFEIRSVSKEDSYPADTVDLAGSCVLNNDDEDDRKVIPIVKKTLKYNFEANYNFRTRKGFAEFKEVKTSELAELKSSSK